MQNAVLSRAFPKAVRKGSGTLDASTRHIWHLACVGFLVAAICLVLLGQPSSTWRPSSPHVPDMRIPL